MEYKYLTRDDLPCWYELGWKPKGPPTIILRVHLDFIKSEKQLSTEAPIVKFLEEEFGLPEFEPSFDHNFGFGGVFINRGLRDDFMEYYIKIPKVRLKSMITCPRCVGAAQVEIFDKHCWRCKGKGEVWNKSADKFDRFYYDWETPYAISATFTIFSLLARDNQNLTSAKKLQLLTVDTMTKKGMHGGSIDGIYSRQLVEYLSSLTDGTRLDEIIFAMRAAYSRMFKGEKMWMTDFDAYIGGQDGWLNVSCPGNACSLNPSYCGINKGEGYEFSCHNVDTPMQQLTLLAGLAALHQKARQEIDKSRHCPSIRFMR